MLLGWVSQMTAILDKPESPAVHDVLINIAQQYPQVIDRIIVLSCVLLYLLVNIAWQYQGVKYSIETSL